MYDIDSMNFNIIKLITIGDVGTGKTSFKKHFGYNGRCDKFNNLNYSIKDMQIHQHKIRIQTFDISEWTYQKNLTELPNIDGAFIFFDLSRRGTFESVKEWKTKLNDIYAKLNKKLMPIVLIANKSDLPRDNITDQEIDKVVTDNNFLGWFSTSIKENVNYDNVLTFLVEHITSNPNFKFVKHHP